MSISKIRKIKIHVNILALILTVVIAGCSSANINSTRLDSPVIIDGNYTEWGKTIKYVKDQDFSFGIANTKEKMYVCLVREGAINSGQLLRNGLIIWIKPDDKRSLQFGIKIKAPRGSLADLKTQSRSGLKNKSGKQNNSGEKFITDMVNRLNENGELQIINSNGDILETLGVDNDLNIGYKTGYSNSQLTYEIEIPLLQSVDNPYSVCTSSNKTAEIEFKSVSREELRKNRMEMRGNRMGNNRGSKAGKSGRGSRGGRNFGKRNMPEVPAIDHSVEITF